MAAFAALSFLILPRLRRWQVGVVRGSSADRKRRLFGLQWSRSAVAIRPTITSAHTCHQFKTRDCHCLSNC